MPLLRPQRFGKVPEGLAPYHRDFMQWVKDSLDIFIGARKSQADSTTPPRSQAVTFGDLDEALAALQAGGSGGLSNVAVGTITRAMDAASGDVSYDVLDFQPRVLVFIAAVQTTSICVGFSDGTTSCVAKGFDSGGGILFAGGTGACISLMESAIAEQSAIVKTLDDDGWTLTWAKSAAPSGAVITISYLALG